MLVKNNLLDESQKTTAKTLDEFKKYKKHSSFFNSIKNFIYDDASTTGIYLHGPVGTGKTMLMHSFYESITHSEKLFIHYQQLIQELHLKIHAIIDSDNISNIVKIVSKEYISVISILCIDEFEIKDIADAMIISKFILELQNARVLIILTSNVTPSDIYKDGIQRESIMHFISHICEFFRVISVDSGIDYRIRRLDIKSNILYPLNQQTAEKIDKIKSDLLEKSFTTAKKINVFNRNIDFAKAHKSMLITNFYELCERYLSYNDYIELCKIFKVIVVENIPIINNNETDKVIRFINFIDNAYFQKIRVIMTLETAPAEIYTKGLRLKEFQRTVSRLNEMDSWIQN